MRRICADRKSRSQPMRKRMSHPVIGRFEFECQVLLVPDRDQRLILYTAEPGSASAAALRDLAATIR